MLGLAYIVCTSGYGQLCASESTCKAAISFQG